jgi:glycosyltransferase involved in cell wall biosynthesis
MLDLSGWLALTRRWSAAVPAALYMHENQLTYPLPADPANGPMPRLHGERDLHYAFINYASMLAADAVLFNSHFHQDAWFNALPDLLKHFPDHNELDSVQELQSRSSVLPLGLPLGALDAQRPAGESTKRGVPPLLIWNHRWEYDKDPASFFRALRHLAAAGRQFRVAVCGDEPGRAPAEFRQARQDLESFIVQWGRVEPFADYARLLWSADVVVSTALHDFFGAAVVEAIYCGCRPVLPNKLAYPEHIPADYHGRCLYQDFEGLLHLLNQALDEPCLPLGATVNRYAWARMAVQYDQVLARIAGR